jgi:copper homeostasis protein
MRLDRMMSFELEICCYGLSPALIAQAAGAKRVELCASPGEGGVTPSLGLIQTVREQLRISLYPIIRPRGGNFLFSEGEFGAMQKDVALCRHLGCDGIATGLLLEDGRVDKKRCGRLVELAYPMGVTFHRAFDHTTDPHAALEDIISIGCERILSSGLQQTALEGASMLRELVERAAGRIIIMPGSGIRASNLAELAALTGASEFHSSAYEQTTEMLGVLAAAG